jgi:hypothetical protein
MWNWDLGLERIAVAVDFRFESCLHAACNSILTMWRMQMKTLSIFFESVTVKMNTRSGHLRYYRPTESFNREMEC